MLVLVARGSRRSETTENWDSDKQYNLAEQMLGMQDPAISSPATSAPTTEVYESENNYSTNFANEIPSSDESNLFEQLISQPQSPPEQLLGMIDVNGLETIEYPVGSGINWQRLDPNQPWSRK